MKKILAAILAGVMTLTALSGCTSKNSGSSSKNASSVSNTASTAVDQSWNKIKSKGTMVLGLDDEFPPMGFQDDKGDIVGFDIDLAKEVAKRLGVTLKLQPINWDTKDAELNTGKIDCIWNGFTITDENKKTILFTEPYMSNHMILVVNADSKYQKMDDLAGKQIGIQSGSSAQTTLDKNASFKSKLKKVVPFEKNTTALLDMKSKKIEAVMLDEPMARYYISQGQKYRVLEGNLSSEDYGVGFRMKDVTLRDKVQETLKAMATDGTAAQISQKWFKKDVTTITK